MSARNFDVSKLLASDGVQRPDKCLCVHAWWASAPQAEWHHQRDVCLKWADRGLSLVNIHHTLMERSCVTPPESTSEVATQHLRPQFRWCFSICWCEVMWGNLRPALLDVVPFHVSLSAVQISLPSKMYISSLPHRYTAAQLHFHWGSSGRPAGSEHTVNSKQYAAEVNEANSKMMHCCRIHHPSAYCSKSASPKSGSECMTLFV